MADYKFGDGIKTIILAGIGAVAYSAEKGQEIIGDLVKKGEITVEQGKDLNKDLQRSFKESMGKRGIDVDEIGEKLTKMSTEELGKIKEQLTNAEKLVSERLKKVEEAIAEAEEAEKAEEAAEEEAVEEEVIEEATEEPAEEAAEEAVEEPAEEEEKAEEAAE